VFCRKVEEEIESPQNWGYTRAYRVLIEEKLTINMFSERTEKPLAAFKRLTGLEKTSAQLWALTGREFRTLKAGDLL
jgi:hypothetical protein